MKTLRTCGSPSALAAALVLAAPLFVANASASGLIVDRTIVIDSSARSVHVNGGDVTRFNANGESFDYRFNSYIQSKIYDLGKIAPAGALNRSVKVYVTADDGYTSSGLGLVLHVLIAVSGPYATSDDPPQVAAGGNLSS